MDNNKINQMLIAADGANHVGEYPSGSYSPMPNRVGSVHAVSDLQEILSLRAQVEQLRKQKKELLLGFDEYKQMKNVADAEIKAQAVRDFIQWGIQKVDPEFAEFADCAEHYISTELSQQANGGE